MCEVKKGTWKIEIAIEGKVISSSSGVNEDEAIGNILQKPLIDILKEAEDVDLDIDIVKTWREQ